MIVPWHAVPNSSKLWLRDFPETDVVSLNLIALDGFLLPWICVIAFWTHINFWHCSILWQLVAHSNKAGFKEEPLFCLFWTGLLIISSDAPSSCGMRVNYNHSLFAFSVPFMILQISLMSSLTFWFFRYVFFIYCEIPVQKPCHSLDLPLALVLPFWS